MSKANYLQLYLSSIFMADVLAITEHHLRVHYLYIPVHYSIIQGGTVLSSGQLVEALCYRPEGCGFDA